MPSLTLPTHLLLSEDILSLHFAHDKFHDDSIVELSIPSNFSFSRRHENCLKSSQNCPKLPKSRARSLSKTYTCYKYLLDFSLESDWSCHLIYPGIHFFLFIFFYYYFFFSGWIAVRVRCLRSLFQSKLDLSPLIYYSLISSITLEIILQFSRY